ncbi:MFS transporter [Corynebacterium glyciniphilum]|uniref:MFS transporter n=1 Tax=Corynebacterium glyciniphilum TaxID=1404244 RepID=UPI003FD3EBA1
MRGSTGHARVNATTMAKLIALAAATFVYVTFEVFPVGLIRDIADGVNVSEGQVGLLVSGYAIVAACATIPTVALASRVSRRAALVVALVCLVIAETLTVASTSFAMLAVSRLIAALTHGVVWSLVAPAAATLVPRERVGTATAVVFGGASLALIFGSPGTTFIGGLIGWRATALLLTGVTIAVTVAVFYSLRSVGEGVAVSHGDAGTSRTEVNWRAVLVLCGISILLVTAHFISYTYIAVIVTEVTGAAGLVVAILTLFGLAGAVGTVLIGRVIERGARRVEVITMSTFAGGLVFLALAMLPLSTGLQYTGVFVAAAVWGLAFAATGPVFQTGVMRIAEGDADRASSVYVTSVQVGIAAGSALGAPILAQSVVWLPQVSAMVALVVLVLVVGCRPTSAADS